MPRATATRPAHFDIAAEAERLRRERGKLTERAHLARLTERGYAYDWQMYAGWCEAMQLVALPGSAETVSLYLTYLLAGGKKVTTATRRAAAIAHRHREEGLVCPVDGSVRALLRGARRIRREDARAMKPLSLENLRAIARLLTADTGVRAVRDLAILVTGWASALRRSNLVSLQLADAEFVAGGVVLHIRREKNNQRGAGRLIGLPTGVNPETCPERCLRAWLERRGGAAGPLFTQLGNSQGFAASGQAVEQMVKTYVRRIGLDPSEYGGHSLRAGFITEAGEAGRSELLIAAQSGHKSMTVLRQYFRRSKLFKANACAGLGL